MTPTMRRYVEGRLFEWVISIIMVMLGIQLLIWPELHVAASFVELLKVMPASAIAWFLFTFGIARVGALVANGRSTFYGPRVRAVGAVAGALLWLQFAYSLIENMDSDVLGALGAPALGIPFWIMFALAELYSAYRAETDARE